MLWIWAHDLEVMDPVARQVAVTGHRLSGCFVLEGRQRHVCHCVLFLTEGCNSYCCYFCEFKISRSWSIQFQKTPGLPLAVANMWQSTGAW